MPAPIVPAPTTAIFRRSARFTVATSSRENASRALKAVFISGFGRLISPPGHRRGGGTPMRRPPRSLVWMAVFAIAVAAVLATAPRAAAAQNAPAWSQGDFWVYTRTAGGGTSTVRIDVNERTTLTLPSGTYNVWHLTTTTTDAGGNSTVQHSWVVDSNLAIAKANFTLPLLGDVQVTFDPPQAGAVFPLTAGAQWSLNTTLRVVGISFSLNIAYSGTVLREQSTSVGAGNYVKRESYDGSGNRVADQELTSYRFQSGSFGLLLIIGSAVVIAAGAIALLIVLRRRSRASMPP